MDTPDELPPRSGFETWLLATIAATAIGAIAWINLEPAAMRAPAPVQVAAIDCRDCGTVRAVHQADDTGWLVEVQMFDGSTRSIAQPERSLAPGDIVRVRGDSLTLRATARN